MKDPGLAIQAAAGARLTTALQNAGYGQGKVVAGSGDGRSLPYVVLGFDTVLPHGSKTTYGASLTHTFVAWALSLTQAKQIAALVVEELTDEDNPLVVEGHHLVLYTLDARMAAMEQRDGEKRYYGVPIRMRYITQEQ